MTNIRVQKSKFDHMVHACVFMGYLFGQKGYKVMNLTSHFIHVNRDLMFLEDQFPFAAFCVLII